MAHGQAVATVSAWRRSANRKLALPAALDADAVSAGRLPDTAARGRAAVGYASRALAAMASRTWSSLISG
jgi:hypothetical protein